jgi:hypothetical protein
MNNVVESLILEFSNTGPYHPPSETLGLDTLVPYSKDAF